MKKTFFAAGCLLLAIGSACDDPPPPVIAAVSYTACTGRGGTCGAVTCCGANNEQRVINAETGEYTSNQLECLVYHGSVEGSYRVNFRVREHGGDVGIEAENIEFSNNDNQPMPVRACSFFEVREGGNRFRGGGNCTETNIREDGFDGGGCLVQAHFDASNTLVGSFECLELQFGSNDLYFSTTYEGSTGAGVFRIENCEFRM